MFIKSWKKDVFTFPNLLSMIRLILIPVYIRVYLQAESTLHYQIAGGILALSCLTDAADGYIARRFSMISTLGKLLDPLADKLTQLSVIACLCKKYPLLIPVLLIFLIKELFQLGAGILHLHRGKMLPGALMAGKLCTTVLFISLILLVFFPEIPLWTVKIIAMLDAVLLCITLSAYCNAYFGPDTQFDTWSIHD